MWNGGRIDCKALVQDHDQGWGGGHHPNQILSAQCPHVLSLCTAPVYCPCVLPDLNEAASVPPIPLDFFAPYDCPASPSSNGFPAPWPTASDGDGFPGIGPEGGGLSPEQLSSYPLASDFARLPDSLRLPPELHAALLGSVMLATAKRMSSDARRGDKGDKGDENSDDRRNSGDPSGGMGGDLLTYKEASEMLGWVMDQAYAMRQEVYRHVK